MIGEISDDDVERAFAQTFKPDTKNEQKGEVFEPNLEADFIETPVKTSLRLHYEAEVEVIRKKLGTLESIRGELGMTRRKMCQLLMVDPSAWTRWTKDETKVPPHIYRSLQWYLALIDKKPEWHPKNAYLGAYRGGPSKSYVEAIEGRLSERLEKFKSREEEAKVYLEDRVTQLKLQLHELNAKLAEREQIQSGWKLLLLINTVVAAAVVGFWLIH